MNQGGDPRYQGDVFVTGKFGSQVGRLRREGIVAQEDGKVPLQDIDTSLAIIKNQNGSALLYPKSLKSKALAVIGQEPSSQIVDIIELLLPDSNTEIIMLRIALERCEASQVFYAAKIITKHGLSKNLISIVSEVLNSVEEAQAMKILGELDEKGFDLKALGDLLPKIVMLIDEEKITYENLDYYLSVASEGKFMCRLANFDMISQGSNILRQIDEATPLDAKVYMSEAFNLLRYDIQGLLKLYEVQQDSGLPFVALPSLVRNGFSDPVILSDLLSIIHSNIGVEFIADEISHSHALLIKGLSQQIISILVSCPELRNKKYPEIIDQAGDFIQDHGIEKLVCKLGGRDFPGERVIEDTIDFLNTTEVLGPINTVILSLLTRHIPYSEVLPQLEVTHSFSQVVLGDHIEARVVPGRSQEQFKFALVPHSKEMRDQVERIKQEENYWDHTFGVFSYILTEVQGDFLVASTIQSDVFRFLTPELKQQVRGWESVMIEQLEAFAKSLGLKRVLMVTPAYQIHKWKDLALPPHLLINYYAKLPMKLQYQLEYFDEPVPISRKSDTVFWVKDLD